MVIGVNVCGIHLPLSESLLEHQVVNEVPIRDEGDNSEAFKTDFCTGSLKWWTGSYIAYQKSVPCSIRTTNDVFGDPIEGVRENLYESAAEYYGKSSLAVFLIPKNESELAAAIRDGLGQTTLAKK